MEITKGKIQKAKKVVIYGPEGIGKSTFAARFPGAVFIDTEGSTNDMDVARLPRPTSWNMLFDEIEYIKTHTNECRTLVIDTVDWAELLCVEHICAVHNKKGIEDFGYGNGYVYTKEEFGRFLNKLSDLIEIGINVVLTAHAQLRKFEQPDELGAYDRWELKLGKKTQSQTSPLVKEWADMLLFANYKTFSIAVKVKVETPEGVCLMNESLLLYDRMQWKLAEFFLSIGAEEVNGKVKMNWNIVPRATGRAIIEQRADRKDPTKKYNHVKKFLPKAKKEYKAGSF